MTRIMLRLDEADLDALKEIAKQKRSTVSQIVRELIANAIAKAEEK